MNRPQTTPVLGTPNRVLGTLALLAMLLQPGAAFAQAAAQEEVLQPGDGINLVVPGRPELDQEFVLDATGQAEITPIGTLKLGGLTRSEAQQLLKQKLRLFYPTLDALEVTVATSGSVRIYVLGGVAVPGSVTFGSEPSVWQVLRAVGGLVELSDPANARVIRETGEAPEVHDLDLSGMMEGRHIVDFALRDGDTLIVPRVREGVPTTGPAAGVKVFGGVGLPTIVPIEEGTPLLDVLMLAGAPVQDADMNKINWVHETGVRAEATLVDLKAYLLLGDPAGNPTVYPGDTVHVEIRKPGWVRQNIPFILGSLAAAATVALAYDKIFIE